jgi:hypothetical protein
MLELSLRHTEVAESLFLLEFATSLNKRENCARGYESVVLRVKVHNPTWGVRIKNFTVKYRTDTNEAQLCPWLTLAACHERGQEITQRIPSVPQEYWSGDEKQLAIRACVPDGINALDFNVSYTIHAEYDIRGAQWDAALSPDFESNLHIKVL